MGLHVTSDNLFSSLPPGKQVGGEIGLCLLPSWGMMLSLFLSPELSSVIVQEMVKRVPVESSFTVSVFFYLRDSATILCSTLDCSGTCSAANYAQFFPCCLAYFSESSSQRSRLELFGKDNLKVHFFFFFFIQR